MHVFDAAAALARVEEWVVIGRLGAAYAACVCFVTEAGAGCDCVAPRKCSLARPIRWMRVQRTVEGRSHIRAWLWNGHDVISDILYFSSIPFFTSTSPLAAKAFSLDYIVIES